MKGGIIWFITLWSLIERINNQNCANSGLCPYSQYYLLNSVYYKCDSSCATCTGPNAADCVTCHSSEFTLNDQQYCVPPYTSQINTVESSYRFYGFDVLSSWTASDVVDCSTSILRGGSTIQTTHTLQAHYKVRMLVSLWWLDKTNSPTTITISFQKSSQDVVSPRVKNLPSGCNPSCFTIYQESTYCPDPVSYNVNQEVITYSHTATRAVKSMTVSFSGTAGAFGIRQYIFIQYLCKATHCQVCSGASSTNCLVCTDTTRAPISGQCKCDVANGYFKHPESDYCVSSCPNRILGQYYGNPLTTNCELGCPAASGNSNWGVLFADDTTQECVYTCPSTIVLGGVSKPLFHDVDNKKCVTNCPSAKAYSYYGNLTCYATCPTNFYKYDKNMSCVSPCPTDTAIPLYGDSTGKCAEQCTGSYYADPVTHKCQTTCTSGYYKDTSTGRNLCVANCPAPQYYGDTYSSSSTYLQCIKICPSSPVKYYGDPDGTGSKRLCMTQCRNNYFGITTGNRTCVNICPNGTWGETNTYTCVTTASGCGSQFGDSNQRLCVNAGACSLGMYSSAASRTCVQSCPNNSYANDDTRVCESTCVSPYYADTGINWCVRVCSTQNLYGDDGSSRVCVATCNQTGGKPFKDFSTKKCVSKCPTSPLLFADLSTRSCVYNCTPGLYAYDDLTATDNNTCLYNCTSPYFGDNSTGYGKCVQKCPDDSPLFGDPVGGVNGSRVCVAVCTMGTYGDQKPSNLRTCVADCPDGYFAQNDTLRRCVTRCKTDTYGYPDNAFPSFCYSAANCPATYVGDPSTNLCVQLCPASQGTFADNISKTCVSLCPNNGTYYFADPTDRWCRQTCTGPNLYGNNNTRTCQTKCIDKDSYADAQHTNRRCILNCTATASNLYFRNNFTKVCVVSTNCPTAYFADNSTWNCVAECPIVNNNQTWGYKLNQTCVARCYNNTFGDASTGIPICVSVCPSVPAKWAYDGNNTCMTMCPLNTSINESLFGQDFYRRCVATCPWDPNNTYQTYSYDITRRCLKNCPTGTYADYKYGICWHYPQNCTASWSTTNSSHNRWGDPYNNSCTNLCTATPWDTFGDNSTRLCTTLCSVGSFADNFTGTRICVAVCRGTYDIEGTPDVGSYDSFGDNNTWHCVLHCLTPNTWADWQTHRCEFQCSGRNTSYIPTYSENFNYRCVIARACPFVPQKLYGENITRKCVTTCKYNSLTDLEWADNITRMCVSQCPNYYNTSNSNFHTKFYGDVTTGSPICVVICATSPRQFGLNSTNKCVKECLDHQYGDQTGNRTCVATCPIIDGVLWFSQLTERICVLVCEDKTWGDNHTQHCQTVPTDCSVSTQYADNSTHLCVALCPQIMNYFGDPTTRLCTDKCPYLSSPVVNITAGINFSANIYFYADYKTRLCVRICPTDHGPSGTFGDNYTNTCVQRCPTGTYGDPQNTYRHCVFNCTAGTYADNLTNRCLSVCPASPPYYGLNTTWTCQLQCPSGQWSDSVSRQCVYTCPNNTYRQSVFRRECVSVCLSNPDLYGDPNTGNCTSNCTASYYADPTDRMCKTSCLPLFQYNYRCVKLCPDNYYANTLGNCVLVSGCNSTSYGLNQTTQCVQTCTGGSFADPNSKYCVAQCPAGWFSDVNVCLNTTCASANTSVSNITRRCQSNCPNFTYHQNGTCVSNCQVLYANNQSKTCASSCPAGLYGDPNTHFCVQTCSSGYYRLSGMCTNTCSPKFKDFITGNCVTKCSAGYWGDTTSYTCLTECVNGEYAYQTASQRTCYTPANLPSSNITLFADPISKKFVTLCQTAPDEYYGDRIAKTCGKNCSSHSSTLYYGDPQSRQCESSCINSSLYSADSLANQCVLRCTLGTYRVNTSSKCETQCPTGYADPSTRICIDICPLDSDTFGYANSSSGDRICVEQCPAYLYAEPINRTCATGCTGSTYALNATSQCVTECIGSFADPSNNRCMDRCLSTSYPNADNSTNFCVFTCPTDPDYYADNNICVKYCTTSGTFASSKDRKCVNPCPNITTPSPYISYADELSGRCVKQCPIGYYGQNSTNKCVKTCASSSYADNLTRLCVSDCPVNQSIYADDLLHICAYTCSSPNFGSKLTQKCIPQCENNYYGDPLTTLCVQVCPVQLYSYGQNTTRTCVTSCIGYTGYADNYSRLCRSKCQDTINPQTFAFISAKACVERCPEGFFAENSTQQCLSQCLTGFADNYTRYCVDVCPQDTETYGDATVPSNKKCVYVCPTDWYTQNQTNLCVDYCMNGTFADPILLRCVKFCSEGTFAQNNSRKCLWGCNATLFADNLTRSCVSVCPASEGTFGDRDTWKCVRICPVNYYARNDTQQCVFTCPKYANGTQSYADNITKYCMAVCPYPLFGRNDTHECVSQCSVSLDEYGHFRGRVCVAALDCYITTNQTYFSDSVSRTCVQVCPQTLWANPNNFRCVQTCDSGWYRNMHNNTCVNICPTEPDEYADTAAKNCVRTCPNDTYAYSNSNSSIRECVASCSTYSSLLFKDNSTNRCVLKCPTTPYMYADSLLGACVFYCSGNQYASIKTQQCVPQCPSQWEYFGNTHTKQCVSLCPPDEFADVLNSRTCQTGCMGSYFSDNDTSKCVLHCKEIKPYYYEDTISKSCVNVCPGSSMGYNPDQTCIYPLNSTKSGCPTTYYADWISRRCVQFCPNGTYAVDSSKSCQSVCYVGYADVILRRCVSNCSNNLFALDNSTGNTCVQFCPSPYFAENATRRCRTNCVTELALQTTRSCQNHCPQPYFARWDNHSCVLNCSLLYADTITRTCISPCNVPAYNDPLTYTCTLLCPIHYFGRNTTRDCNQTCLNGSFADPSTRICVGQCPDAPLLFADSRTNQCVQTCYGLFGYTINRTCLSSCPNVSAQIYLADSDTHLCVLQCVSNPLTFADYRTNLCIDLCSNGTFASNYTKQCLFKCPSVPNDTFADNDSRICVKRCKTGSYGEAVTLICVEKCWEPNFADPTTNLCVQICPLGYFSRNTTRDCYTGCPQFEYADPTTRRCVGECPAVADLFKFDENWTCILECPGGYYKDQNIRKCVRICNSTVGMYSYDLTNECLRQCPFPYRGYDVDHSCILQCPNPYFYNKTRNKCTRCALNCVRCTSPQNCLECGPGLNLFNGICNNSCIPSETLVTYAHPTTGLCVQICPGTYYGSNQTYACVQTCPTKQYGSNVTLLCQKCPMTCARCLSPTICSLCEGNATMAIDHMCYSDCNATHKYYFNSQCYSICPNGTFLTFSNVNCEKCSVLCGTCSGSGSNCLSCSGRYHYQNTCLVQCPTGFYGSLSNNCISCVGSSQPACQLPVKFTTTMYRQNFKYVINVTFNQQVSIQKQIQNILKIKLQLNRRLLSISDLVNTGVSYTYQILTDGTIKLILNVVDNLVNPVFVVQITDPTAIKSFLNNGTLQNSESEIILDTIEYYSPEQSIYATTNTAAKFVVVFVLVLYLLTFLFSNTVIRIIQFLQILTMHAVISVNIPATLYYYLVSLKPSLLQFLPNWMSQSLPNSPLHTPCPLKVSDVFIDFNFMRNNGQILFLIVLFSPLVIIFVLLSNPRLVTNRTWRNFFSAISTNRFWFMVLYDIVSILYVPVLWFGFMQLGNINGNGLLAFNAFLTVVLLILFIAAPFIWLLLWRNNTTQDYQHKYWFMTHRLKKQPSRCMLEPIISSWHLILTIIWMTGLYQYPQPQLFMLILTHLTYIIFLLIILPYQNLINSIMTIFSVIVAIIVESYMLYISFNKNLTVSSKLASAYPVIILISVILIMVLIWCIWRCICQVLFTMGSFKDTELYKILGDPQVEVPQEKSEVYETFEKPALSIVEQKQQDILIDKIYKEVKEDGHNVIKVRKRVLKKKIKPNITSNIKSEHIELPQQQEQQYIRINKPNPFDFSEKKQEKNPMKRIIDDDIRDQISDDQDNYYQQKSSNLNQKAIFLQQNQNPLISLDDINKKRQESEENQAIKEDQSSKSKQNYKDLFSQQQSLNPYQPDKENDQALPKNKSKYNVFEELELGLESIHGQKKQESQNIYDIDENIDDNRSEIKDQLPKQKPRPIEELLEEEDNKKKKMLFLFEDFEEQSQQ